MVPEPVRKLGRALGIVYLLLWLGMLVWWVLPRVVTAVSRLVSVPWLVGATALFLVLGHFYRRAERERAERREREQWEEWEAERLRLEARSNERDETRRRVRALLASDEDPDPSDIHALMFLLDPRHKYPFDVGQREERVAKDGEEWLGRSFWDPELVFLSTVASWLLADTGERFDLACLQYLTYHEAEIVRQYWRWVTQVSDDESIRARAQALAEAVYRELDGRPDDWTPYRPEDP